MSSRPAGAATPAKSTSDSSPTGRVPAGLWLKTDLFEERSPDRALLPSLDSAAWIGVDLSTEVAGRARALIGCRSVVADIRSLPFASGTFDGVLSTSTLDHFAETASIDRSLRELRRVLHPADGCCSPSTTHATRSSDSATPCRRTGPAAPVWHRSRSGGPTTRPPVVAALEAAGFDVDATAHLLHAPHVVGTRPARFRWYERTGAAPHRGGRVAPRLAPFTGHYVAFSARARIPEPCEIGERSTPSSIVRKSRGPPDGQTYLARPTVARRNTTRPIRNAATLANGSATSGGDVGRLDPSRGCRGTGR